MHVRDTGILFIGALWGLSCLAGASGCLPEEVDAGGLTPAAARARPLDVPCENIPAQGCCDGTNVKRCENNTLYKASCQGDPKCGWDAAKKTYACGTSGGADPSSTYPLSCVNYEPDGGQLDSEAGQSKPCENYPAEGCCEGTELRWCENGGFKDLDCSKDPQCGWDSTKGEYACGTSGGADPSGKRPKSCSGYGYDGGNVADEAGGPNPNPCGKFPPQGCCRGSVHMWCEEGRLEDTDCQADPKCGWDSAKGEHACGTSGGADPSGKYPLSCAGYEFDGGPAKDDAFPVNIPERDEAGCSCAVQSGWPGWRGAAAVLALLGLVGLVRRRPKS